MQRAPSTRVAIKPNERVKTTRETRSSHTSQNESDTQSQRQPPSIPRRSLSIKPMDNTVASKAETSKPAARSISPSKLPMGAHQRSASVKVLPAAPSLKPTGHQRTGSLNKTPSLRKPSDASSLPPSKLTQHEMKIGQSIAPKRQISPTRQVSRLQEPKSQISGVTTRSTSTALKANGTRAEAVTAEKKARSSITPPISERPSFTTHQQKFSPQKQRIGSREKTSDEPGPPEHTRETLEPTLELLHLHYLHRDSAKVQHEWAENAKWSYRKQFDVLVTFNETLNGREKDLMEQGNATALMAWGNMSDGISLERKLQILSVNLAEAYDLTESNGKYTTALQAFEHWHGNAQAILRRRFDKRGAGSRIDVVEGLGDGWKAEIASLQSRVFEISNSVLALGDVQVQSDLSRCVTGLSEMLMNMIQEIEMMQDIEVTMVKQEHFWMQSSIDRMASDLRGTTID